MAEKMLQYEINRDLLNPNFEGYKLSLEKFSMKKLRLPTMVYLPKIANSQFALLHQHLFVNHNFLCYDFFEENDQISQIFTILDDFCVYNIKYFKDSGKFDLQKVFEIDFSPEIDKNNDDQARYNATISLPSAEYAFVANGYGYLWLCDRRQGVWKVLFSDSNILNGNAFTIVDSVQKSIKMDQKENVSADSSAKICSIDSLLKTVIESEENSGKFINKFVWLSFEIDDKNVCKLVQKRSIIVEEVVEFASLSRQKDLNSICILCNKEPKFLEDTLNPIVAESEIPKSTVEDVPMDPVSMEKIPSEADMTATDDKQDAADPFNSRPAFNPDDLEECDMVSADTLSLTWLDGDTHKILRNVDLGGHQWLFSARIDPQEPPYICLRFDVDAILWRVPSNPQQLGQNSAHFSTFDAFGYVQAAKESRRLVTCDTSGQSFAVIADLNRNVYVYWRAVDLAGSELRNRRTGHVINRVSKQNLISLNDEADQSILGLTAARNDTLFVLTEATLFAFNLKSFENV